MTKNMENLITVMENLYTKQKELDREIEEIKAAIIAEDNTAFGSYCGTNYVISVTKPAADSVSLDTDALKTNAPKTYANLLSKYSKIRRGRSATVSCKKLTK